MRPAKYDAYMYVQDRAINRGTCTYTLEGTEVVVCLAEYGIGLGIARNRVPGVACGRLHVTRLDVAFSAITIVTTT